MNAELSVIAGLQAQPDRVRNVCVLAHVDHGKTTLSDHLIAAAGLIHPRLAGELRFLDSLEEEQARGITMKASSIALLHREPRGAGAGAGAAPPAGGGSGGGTAGGAGATPAPPPGSAPAPPPPPSDDGLYLISLIDSPGHVDFCSEVSTAARLCDGALVVVDAVEGVCAQTHAVLRQAWEERLGLVLVVNKIDRLVLELRLSPVEAAARLRAVVAHANMVVSAFQSERFISQADALLGGGGEGEAAASVAAARGGGGEGEPAAAAGAEPDDEADTFSPERGNVCFGSAADGWAFRLPQLAAAYAARTGASAGALRRALWGDYALDPKTRRVVRCRPGGRPLFVQLALEPLWKAYGPVLERLDAGGGAAPAPAAGGDPGHTAFLERMVAGLSLEVAPRALRHPEPRGALRAVLRAWLPLAAAVLGAAAECLPSPAAAARARAARLLPPRPPGGAPPALAAALAAQAEAVARCDAAAGAPLVVYISKMVAVPAAALPRPPGAPAPPPGEEAFLAFGRVFSGTLRPGDEVDVLSPAHDPTRPAAPPGGGGDAPAGAAAPAAPATVQRARVGALYLMMGRGLEALPAVPAGSVLAVAGLGDAVLKSATLVAAGAGGRSAPLAAMAFQSAALVRVAVEAARPGDEPALRRGLALLERADPMVAVEAAAGGEHVLAAAGEVHLQTCLKDLRERFARVELVVSPPLVAFRESVAEGGGGRVVEVATSGGGLLLRVRASPLPAAVAAALERATDALRGGAGAGAGADADADAGAAGVGAALLRAAGDDAGAEAALRRAWAFGPRRCGPNVLLAGGAAGAPSLWDVPAASVVRLQKQGQAAGAAAALGGARAGSRPDLAAAGAGEDEGGEGGGDAAAEAPGVVFSLGCPEAAQRLGLAGAAPPGAASAAGRLAAALGELGLTDESDFEGDGGGGGGGAAAGRLAALAAHVVQSAEAGAAAGFQMAAAAGPLCDEPLWGVAFEVEARLVLTDRCQLRLAERALGPLTGQAAAAVRAAARRAAAEAGPRLVEAVYLVEVAAPAEALAPAYAVLGRRRGRVLREDLREGSGLFTVLAALPAEASFGFADELRRRTSGAAAATVVPSHWERLAQDPFFAPTTEEEREELGEDGQGAGEARNLARRLVDGVRRRKGLPVEDKVVASATKQRTRARKV